MTNTKKTSSDSIYDVAIIGAGLSGSLCAHLMSNMAQSVCVIDKSRGSGGRAGSKRLTEDTSVDLGTPFIQINRNHIENSQTLNTDILGIMNSLVNQNIAARVETQSQEITQTFVGLPRMSAICRHFLKNSTLITSTRVRYLEQNAEDQLWSLIDSNAQQIVQAKKVIICIPAQQAADLLASTNDLEVLSSRAHKAMKGSTAQWAMWVKTPVSSLPTIIETKDAVIHRLIKDSKKVSQQDSNSELWVIHSQASWTQQNLEKNKELIAQELIRAFSEQTDLTSTQHGQPHRWLFARFLANTKKEPYQWDQEQRVGLAGDWLSTGNTEGALLSAVEIVKKIQSVSLKSKGVSHGSL